MSSTSNNNRDAWRSRISGTVVLWVAALILVIETIILIPSLYQREAELIATSIDTTTITRELLAYALRIAGMVLLITLVVTAGTWALLQRIVVRPLRELITTINEPGHAVLPNWRRKDEIGELIHAYNEMTRATDSAERREQIKQKQLEYIAYHDPLTNLPNRRAFIEQLLADERDTCSTVFLIGVDKLALIGDQYGAETVDAILAETGRRLAALCAKDSFCARLEGDEFGVIHTTSSVCSKGALLGFADQACRAARALHRVHANDIYITVSVGIAQAGGAQPDLETAHKNAAIAVRRARRSGGDRHCLFDQHMRETQDARLRLLAAMETAVESEEFFPVYQPKICLRSGELVGVECLARWQNCNGQMISPADFVPLAEESGLIVPIGEQMLRQSLRDALHWTACGADPLKMAVNLSAVQLKDRALPIKIAEILRELLFPAAQLELEITESAIMENISLTVDVLAAFNALGIDLAIDDFGTGHSSLSYLKTFPVQTLKVDQSFVRNICSDKGDESIVRAVVALARQFELNVVVEGIEDDTQRALLVAQGCDIGQGYFFGKPMDSEAFLNWTQSRVVQAPTRQKQHRG